MTTTTVVLDDERLFEYCKLSPISKRNYAFALKGFKQYAGIKDNILNVEPEELKQ
jgi:hypothetical protein